VPQSAMASLNPVHRVGDQIVEAILATPEWQARGGAEGAPPLRSGRSPGRPDQKLSSRIQRRHAPAGHDCHVPGPRSSLIIMDEPTTGLDVLVQERILRKLAEIRQQVKKKKAILLITHDISVIAEMSDRIGIMYAGRLMESALPWMFSMSHIIPTLWGSKTLFRASRRWTKNLFPFQAHLQT